MATHDYDIANQSGAAFRTDLNNALAAIQSNNSNSSSPSTTVAYQWWADTTTGTLKIRNSSNNAWIELFQLDGTITLEDGSASAPALANRGDLDTGVFFSADNTFNVATGGTERMELGATTIFNESGADVDFRIEGDSDANLFYLDASADRIGVGTNSPAAKVYICETGTLTGGDINTNADALVIDNNGGNTGITFKTPNTASSRIAFGDPQDNNIGQIRYDHSSNDLAFDVNASERLIISSAGRCGIGISSPSNQLHVKHATTNTVALFESGDAQVVIAFKDNSTSTKPAIGATNDDMVFFTGDTQRMTILNGGNIGINETSPSNALHVKHATQNGVMRLESGDEFVHLEFKDSTTSNIPYIGAQGDDLRMITGGTNRLTIDSSGNFIPPSSLVVLSDSKTQGQTFMKFQGHSTSNFSVMVFGANSGGHNTASTAVALGKHSTNSRSLNAAGTVNASGNDYAEYMTKSGDFTIAKGDICGIDANGKLTNKFSESISFVVKSTDPSYVGGDAWGTEEILGEKPDDDSSDLPAFEEKLEAARKMVDRIAFSGQVPVNVTGATAGQHIIPTEGSGDTISGVAKAEASLSIAEYMSSVGKVITLESDGRARIIVKVA